MLLSRFPLRDIDDIVESPSQGYRCYCREFLLRDIDAVTETNNFNVQTPLRDIDGVTRVNTFYSSIPPTDVEGF